MGTVRIRQKAIKHTPLEKLTDAFIAILAGAHGLSGINTRVRPDAALQRAFGRKGCAEQSVVQETLAACTAKNVVEMQAAVAELFRAHSAAYRHDYEAELQDLDADLSGLPCGERAGQATKGYFSQPRARYGRQLGRAVVKEGDYARPVQRLAPRWRKRDGQRSHALLIPALEPADVLRSVGRPLEQLADPQAVLVAYAELYDQRGGAVEIKLEGSKQGVGLAKRDKKSYTGQQMVVLLSALAPNVIVWAKRWLAERAPKLKKYGVQRVVRDVVQVGGQIEPEGTGTIKRIRLNQASALGRHSAKSLRALLKQEQVRVILGKT